MKKNYKFIILMVSALILLVVISFGFSGLKDEVKKVNETDAQKFKREYEELNGKEVSGRTYTTLEIDEENPIKYTNVEEIDKLMEDGTGIIYFGYPKCPWCRTAVPALLHAADDAGIDTIYYMDMTNERSSYVIEDGELIEEKKGTEEYYQLLNIFSAFLDNYIIQDEDGNDYFVGEQRIYVPLVFFIRDGEVIAVHMDTIESQENPFKELNEEQYEELYGIYSDYIHDMLGDLCDERC